MITCPCCSRQLLRHIRQNQIHWFCRSCWQSMPNLNQGVALLNQGMKKITLKSGSLVNTGFYDLHI